MAEYAVVEPEFLAKVPEGMVFVEAASVPRAALTSWQALKVRGGGYVKSGMRVEEDMVADWAPNICSGILFRGRKRLLILQSAGFFHGVLSLLNQRLQDAKNGI